MSRFDSSGPIRSRPQAMALAKELNGEGFDTKGWVSNDFNLIDATSTPAIDYMRNSEDMIRALVAAKAKSE